MNGALLTDLYELTMLQAYFEHRLQEQAVFEFFVRKLPQRRNFLMAAGLEQALDYLETFHFTADELTWLSEQKQFRPRFVKHLEQLRFTGDVHAMPEGTIFFPDEPILRITAPLPEAQVVDVWVQAGKQDQVPVRVIALRLPEEVVLARMAASMGSNCWTDRRRHPPSTFQQLEDPKLCSS